jgi:hypothetical protein
MRIGGSCNRNNMSDWSRITFADLWAEAIYLGMVRIGV